MLHPISHNIWEASTTLKLAPGLRLPARSILIKLQNGDLWLHSPIRFDDDTVAQINTLGKVAHIIAPNKFHHLFLKKAATRWPTAALYHAPGLPKKREDIDFSASTELSDQTKWNSEISAIPIQGTPLINETAFYHAPSKSLIVTDLVFNLSHTEGALSGLVFGLMGFGGGKFSQSRLFANARKDKAATRESLQKLLLLDLDRVIMAHGDIVTEGLPESFEKALTRGLA